MHNWTVSEGEVGRLDIFLAKNDAVVSRIKARDMIKEGLVMVNGRIARKPALVLNAGDTVEVSASGEPVTETRLHSADLDLSVLYEDDACMVILKPGGISVHPGSGIPKDADTILHGIAHLFKERKIPFSSGAVLVHRLDKDTTGALLVAKNPKAHKMLQKQFEDRTVQKTYLAIVAGVPSPPSAMIDASIGRSAMNRTKMTAFGGSGKTREARTTYRTLDASKTAALLACDLHTGRTHQIRVHLQAIHHPILGDQTYKNSESEKLSEQEGIESLCLHAWQLTFHSPADDKDHTVSASLPDSFQTALSKFGLNKP